MDTFFIRLRPVALIVCMAILATGCSVEAATFDDLAGGGGAVGPGADGDHGSLAELAVLGPSLSSHWHAAYIVRICGDVLEPFESDDDPLGIHSHQDGLIHIHPFFDEAAYEATNLGLFADAMGVTITEGELTVPGSGTWRDGDQCDDGPGRVFVDKWPGPTPGGVPVRYFEDIDKIRFDADREIYQIGFAPQDSAPVVPPSVSQLDQVSAPINTTEPWVVINPADRQSVITVWPVAEVAAVPCSADAVVERVAWGTPSCFVPGDVEFSPAEAFVSARPVNFNRQAAVEVVPTPALRQLLAGQFLDGLGQGDGDTGEGLVIVIQIGDEIVTASRVLRYSPDQSRLVLTGGFTPATARDLAALLTG